MTSVVSWCFGIAFFLLGSIPVFCQDFLKAKVLAVDTEKMEIEVLTQASENANTPGFYGEKFLVQIAAENDLPRKRGTVIFPGCVVSGNTIRIWGQTVENKENKFIATDIRRCREGRCSDPTGVRYRLLRSRKNQQSDDAGEFKGSGFASGRRGGGRSGAGDGGGK